MSDFKIDLSSWSKAATGYSEAGADAVSALTKIVDATTDPAACNAANGLATVDGAIAIMLSVFGEVMNGTVATSLSQGLSAEAQALADTGTALQEMESSATDQAANIARSLS